MPAATPRAGNHNPRGQPLLGLDGLSIAIHPRVVLCTGNGLIEAILGAQQRVLGDALRGGRSMREQPGIGVARDRMYEHRLGAPHDVRHAGDSLGKTQVPVEPEVKLRMAADRADEGGEGKEKVPRRGVEINPIFSLSGSMEISGAISWINEAWSMMV